MRALAAAAGSFAILTVSSCATPSTDKPVITRRVVRELLATCHASGGQFYRGKRGLPYFSVKSAVGEVATQGAPTPTVECVGRGAQAYRYKYMRLDDVAPSED